jgi:amino acid transporter
MIYLGIIIGLGLMAGMIYLAVDKKSNTGVRIASLVALGIMVITIIICLFIIFTDTSVLVDESVLIVGAPVEVNEEGGSNIIILVLLILMLLALFCLIAFQAMKENRKSKALPEETAKPTSFW